MATPSNRPNLADTIKNLYFSVTEEDRVKAAKELVNELGNNDVIKNTPLYQEALTEENLLRLPKPELTPPGKPGYLYPDPHTFSDEFKKFAEKQAKEKLQLKNEDQPDKVINYLVEKQLKLEEAEKAIEEYEKFAAELEKTGKNINDQNQRLQIINFMMSGLTDENGQPIPMEEVASVIAIPANQQKNDPISPQEIQGRVIQLHKAKEGEDKLKAAGTGVPIRNAAELNALTGISPENQTTAAGEAPVTPASRPSPGNPAG